jgi:hypothetical protein
MEADGLRNRSKPPASLFQCSPSTLSGDRIHMRRRVPGTWSLRTGDSDGGSPGSLLACPRALRRTGHAPSRPARLHRGDVAPGWQRGSKNKSVPRSVRGKRFPDEPVTAKRRTWGVGGSDDGCQSGGPVRLGTPHCRRPRWLPKRQLGRRLPPADPSRQPRQVCQV